MVCLTLDVAIDRLHAVEAVLLRRGGDGIRALGKSKRTAGDDAAKDCCPESIVEDESPRDQSISRNQIHRLKEQRHEHTGRDSGGNAKSESN
jgi:hypothetical protein